MFYWLTISLGALSLAALNTFLQWGAEAGGGAFTGAAFLSPSTIVDVGFRVALPIQELLQQFTGMAVVRNFPIVVHLHGGILADCARIYPDRAPHDHHDYRVLFCGLLGAVLFPWGLLSQTAFLCEFVVSWLTAGLIRVLLTVGIMSISVPLFEGNWPSR